MTSSLCNARLPRTITAAVAVLVLAASAAAPALASSPASEPRLHELCAGVTLPECERQLLASRGIGAPAPAAAGDREDVFQAGDVSRPERIASASVSTRSASTGSNCSPRAVVTDAR